MHPIMSAAAAALQTLTPAAPLTPVQKTVTHDDCVAIIYLLFCDQKILFVIVLRKVKVPPCVLYSLLLLCFFLCKSQYPSVVFLIRRYKSAAELDAVLLRLEHVSQQLSLSQYPGIVSHFVHYVKLKPQHCNTLTLF